ncbi:MAG TPA: hypothetical protein VNG53_06490 [Bacteroidia bacterium]|nr:hypothetical protein [Bacteroidia bacterium]
MFENKITNLSDCLVENIFPANENLFLDDVFLVIIHATKIPPHLAVAINGKLFSLSVKGISMDGDLSNFIKLIHQKKIETLFIRLSVPEIFTINQLREEIKKCLLVYPKVDGENATCLTPIKDFCASIYQVPTEKINFVFDLLPELRKKNNVLNAYHFNLENQLINNTFILKKYTMHDIYQSIQSVNFV